MTKHLSVGITDELWEAFKNTYALKNETTHEAADTEAIYEVRDIMCDAIKAYVHSYNESPATHRTAMDNINEANAIAESIPAMRLYKSVGVYGPSTDWSIWLDGSDYKVKARGSEALLREVKEAKAFWEALQDLEAKEQEDAVRLEEEDESEAIRMDSLDHSTKEILLHFIENLTIGKAVDILADGNYPHLALDELYAISVQLKLSLVEGDDWK